MEESGSDDESGGGESEGVGSGGGQSEDGRSEGGQSGGTVNRRLLLVALSWLITAVIATGAGITVIGLLGRPLAGGPGDVLSAKEAGEALARATASPRPSPPSPSPSPPVHSPSAEATPTGEPSASSEATGTPRPQNSPDRTTRPTSKVITTRGGSVVARCDGRRVTLRSWSPAQGYETDDVDPGPDDEAKVKFERDDDEVEVEIRCSASGPVATVES